jgi:hypothetical protein
MLSRFALEAYNDHHLYDLEFLEKHVQKYHHPSLQYAVSPSLQRPVSGGLRGLMVDYENIPGILLTLLYPLWGLTPPRAELKAGTTASLHSNISSISLTFSIPSLLSSSTASLAILTALTPQTLRAMKEQSTVYSKNGNKLGTGGKFQGDSETKETWANDEITAMGERILQQLYEEMRKGSLDDLSSLMEKYLPSPPSGQEMTSALATEQLKSLPFPEITGLVSTEKELQSGDHQMASEIKTPASVEQPVEERSSITWKTPHMFDSHHHSTPYEVPPSPPTASLPDPSLAISLPHDSLQRLSQGLSSLLPPHRLESSQHLHPLQALQLSLLLQLPGHH